MGRSMTHRWGKRINPMTTPALLSERTMQLMLTPLHMAVELLPLGHFGREHAYAEVHDASYRDMMRAKLGLAKWRVGQEGDDGLLERLHRLLAAGEVDMSLFFRRLAEVDPAAPALEPLAEAFYDPARRATADAELLGWLREHGARVLAEGQPAAARRAEMNRVNPLYVPRNYLAQQAIDAAEAGDTAELETLLEVLETKMRVGDEVTLTYYRDGQQQQATAVLGEQASD